jgi:hypothetical protein
VPWTVSRSDFDVHRRLALKVATGGGAVAGVECPTAGCASPAAGIDAPPAPSVEFPLVTGVDAQPAPSVKFPLATVVDAPAPTPVGAGAALCSGAIVALVPLVLCLSIRVVRSSPCL